MDNRKLPPFLKWPGGKRWFVKRYLERLPLRYDHYYEPFLGGGSLFFALQPCSATIADTNSELINLYIVMRENPNGLKMLMQQHQMSHSKTYYYQVRENPCVTEIESAARFLYLNRTCYNGMYRVNKDGCFNVPIGTKQNCIYDIDLFDRYARVLKGAEILVNDFEKTIAKAQRHDLIFADPPYVVRKRQEGFIKYNDKLFTWSDQERLFNCLMEAKRRGTAIILTNVNCKEIQEMYLSGGFYIEELKRTSTIAGSAPKRGVVTELLITSYKTNELMESTYDSNSFDK